MINVTKPKTELDQQFWEHHLKNKKKYTYSKLIHVPWQLNTKYSVVKKDRKWFHEIIKKYKKSAYTPYVAFSLGRNYSALSISDANSRSTYEKKARTLFKKTLELTDNSLLKS